MPLLWSGSVMHEHKEAVTIPIACGGRLDAGLDVGVSHAIVVIVAACRADDLTVYRLVVSY